MSGIFSKSLDNTDVLMISCGVLIGLGLRSKLVFGGFARKVAGITSVFRSISPADYKLVLVVRNDLQMGKGKMCAQCSHASVLAYSQALFSNPAVAKAWGRSGQEKIVVQTDSESSLLRLESQAKTLGLETAIVQDSGRTQVQPGTKTVLALGPGLKSQIDRVTIHLKLL